MVKLKTAKELEMMRQAGRISARALKVAGEAIEPGVSTREIDDLVRKYIKSAGAVPSFLNYNGFPSSACISVNEEVIHGIPNSSHILKNGDIVSVDVGAYFNGFHGDNAFTFACGDISKEAQNLLDVTQTSLFEGISAAKAGNRVGDIGSAVEEYVKARGYSVVRDFVGHGVGTMLHEDPSVPNYGKKGHGTRLVPGMTIAVEPMVNVGTGDVKVLSDGWTTITLDGKLSAHFEHSIAITSDGPVILTDPN